VSSTSVDKDTRKYIFRYVEKVFITKKFIDKILRQYVNTTHIKWYDLFNNTDAIKDFFAYKLKKLIVSTIYELQDKTIAEKKTKTKTTASRVKHNNHKSDDDSDSDSIWDNE